MKEIVLITGASSGIGKATAELLAKAGYIVYGSARNPQEVSQGVTMLAMDVRDTASVQQAIATIMQREGRIDILINNAGVGITGAIEETPIEALENAFETNFFGAVRTIQAYFLLCEVSVKEWLSILLLLHPTWACLSEGGIRQVRAPYPCLQRHYVWKHNNLASPSVT